jgi:hypothetical protein
MEVIFKNIYPILTFISTVGFITLLIIYICQHKNNETQVDDINFTSELYRNWMNGNTGALTLTIPEKLVNHKVYLNIKNNIKDINIILPLATTLKENDVLELFVDDTKNNVSFTYYLYENNINSIFQTNTYFLNSQYNLGNLKVVNSSGTLIWSCVGAGVLENT